MIQKDAPSQAVPLWYHRDISDKYTEPSFAVSLVCDRCKSAVDVHLGPGVVQEHHSPPSSAAHSEQK